MRKNIIRFLFLYLLLLNSCSTSKKYYRNWNELIQGEWKLVTTNQTIYDYPVIHFDSKINATFGTHADTILHFIYKINHNELLLKNQNQFETVNRITKLTKDSLIFGTLLENNFPQFYIRIKSSK